MPAASDAAPPRALVQGLRRLLRPLVRLLLSQRITYPFLANLLKSLYVEVAERELALPDKPQTISRVTLLTGVHRKDVKRLRQEVVEEAQTPASVSLGAQLVARWTGVPEFCSADGAPPPLPRLSGSDPGPSFETLVASVSKDIRPRSVLDEWLRLGIVHVDASDRVCLNTGAFVPEEGFDEKAYYFGRNLHDHIATAAHNLSGSGPARLERSVYYADLTPASLDELAELAEQQGMQALQRVNRRAIELKRRDGGAEDAVHRMSFGVYFHRERSEDEPGDA
jgi:hypothetical protein